jgi:hypothetical protein
MNKLSSASSVTGYTFFDGAICTFCARRFTLLTDVVDTGVAIWTMVYAFVTKKEASIAGLVARCACG